MERCGDSEGSMAEGARGLCSDTEQGRGGRKCWEREVYAYGDGPMGRARMGLHKHRRACVGSSAWKLTVENGRAMHLGGAEQANSGGG